MNTLNIGDEFQGGIVFLVDEAVEHGLIVSREDLSATADWNEAIEACSDFRGGGFTDWRLPSIEELDLIYKAKHLLGNFVRFSYWSATEYAEHFAWFQNFYNGTQDNDFKDNTCYVRAIRSF